MEEEQVPIQLVHGHLDSLPQEAYVSEGGNYSLDEECVDQLAETVPLPEEDPVWSQLNRRCKPYLSPPETAEGVLRTARLNDKPSPWDVFSLFLSPENLHHLSRQTIIYYQQRTGKRTRDSGFIVVTIKKCLASIILINQSCQLLLFEPRSLEC